MRRINHESDFALQAQYLVKLNLVGNVGEMRRWCLVVGSEEQNFYEMMYVQVSLITDVMNSGRDCFRNQKIT